MSVAPTRGRPRDKSVDKAVLKATIDRLTRDGYERTSIDDIARDAGVTRPTVYRRWASKDELVIAAVADSVRATTQERTGNVREDLFRQAQSLFVHQSKEKFVGLMGTAIVERVHHREIYDHFLTELIRPRRRQVREIITDGIDQGVVRSDVDVEVVIAMFVGSFYAVTLAEEWSEPNNETWPERLTNSIMALIECQTADVEKLG